MKNKKELYLLFLMTTINITRGVQQIRENNVAMT